MQLLERKKGRFYYMTPMRWVVLVSGVLAFSALCSVLAGIYTYWSNAHLGPAAQLQAIKDVLILPVLLAAPPLSFLGLKLFEIDLINKELQNLASTDVLTGLLNRRAFLDRVDDFFRDRRGNNSGGFLIADADRFKDINDTLGHHGGDAALHAIALSIQSSVRDEDIVARFGGEEFTVFLPNATAEVVAEVAERIVKNVNSVPFATGGRSVRLAVSVGGATFDSAVEFDWLYRLADVHLYEAKSKGRNRAIVVPLAA